MKNILFLGLIACITLSLSGQATDTLLKTTDEPGYEIIENEDVEIKTDEIVKEGKKDTTNIVIGDNKVSIVEQEGETSIIIKEDEDKEDEEWQKKWDDDDSDNKSKKKNKFKGHWAGFEFGLNNYVDQENSLSRTVENEFMDINTGRSWNINLNFSQYSLPIISNHLGLVTGLGLEWSNYHFSNSNTIQKLDGIIQPDTLSVSGSKKNRLQTTYLTAPLLLEVQLFDGDRDDRLYLAGGVIGGVKLFSNTKIVYFENNGSKVKDKTRDDYYLSPFRYGLTARAGYKMIKVYVNYYMSPLFLNNRGPELYPVAAGLVVSF